MRLRARAESHQGDYYGDEAARRFDGDEVLGEEAAKAVGDDGRIINETIPAATDRALHRHLDKITALQP